MHLTQWIELCLSIVGVITAPIWIKHIYHSSIRHPEGGNWFYWVQLMLAIPLFLAAVGGIIFALHPVVVTKSTVTFWLIAVVTCSAWWGPPVAVTVLFAGGWLLNRKIRKWLRLPKMKDPLSPFL